MDSRTKIDDPAYWRQRAEETRRLAPHLSDAVAKQTLEEIAAAYEQLAKLAKHGANNNPD